MNIKKNISVKRRENIQSITKLLAWELFFIFETKLCVHENYDNYFIEK